MMISIFERDFEKEIKELKNLDLSELEYNEMKYKLSDNLNLRILLSFFEDILSRKEELNLDDDNLRRNFDYIFDKYRDNEYIDEDYFIQKNESEFELSYEDYKNNLFGLLIDNDDSSRKILREIF